MFLPLLIWGVADLFFILSVTVAISFGILLPSLQKELHLSTAELGFLGFAFFFSFGVVQFWTGRLIDSRGPRLVLTIAALTASIGLLLLSYANHLMWAALAQVITGVGFSVSYVGAIYLAQTWFTEKQFPVFSGITQMSANLISSSALLFMALSGAITADVHEMALSFSLLSFLLALLALFFVRKAPIAPSSKAFPNIFELFKISQFWFTVLYFGTHFGAFLAFSSLWNIPDSLSFGHSLKLSTMMSATLRFGGAFGALLSGILARSFNNYGTVVKLYSTGTFILGALLIYGPPFPVPLTFCIMALLGFFAGGTAMGFPLVAKHIPPELKGAGFGLMTSFGYLLSAFYEYLVGSVLHLTHAFAIALTPLALSFLIGWICSLKLQEKNAV